MKQSKEITDIIRELKKKKEFVLAAVDGRCGAGKTTLAAKLQEKLNCNVIHMDDFFLRPSQRSEKRLAEPGGNVDHERFLEEVLLPLKQNKPFSYRPYSCKTGDFAEPVIVTPAPITIVEGSYSCHPELWNFYDLHIFVDIDPDEQMKRIIKRNGETAAKVFKNKWIPLEEAYFKAFDIERRCEIRV